MRLTLVGVMVSSAVILTLLYLLAMLATSSTGLYGLLEPFGPLSRNPLTATLLFASISSAYLTAVWIQSHRVESRFLLLIGCVLVGIAITSKYLVPSWSDSFYQTTFTDSISHITGTEYVLLTGHSSVANPGAFIAWQPGFWITTAAFIEVVMGAPSSAFALPFSLALKWSPVVNALIYLPVVFYLERSYGLRNRASIIALITFFGLGIFSYDIFYEQSLAYPLFWLLLALLPGLLERADTRRLILLAVISGALVITHQVYGVMAEVALLSVLVLRVAPKFRGLGKGVAAASAVFSIVWLTDVFFNSGSFPISLVATGLGVYKSLFGQGIVHAFVQESQRAFPAYINVIRVEEGYFTAVTVLPLLALLYVALRTKSRAVVAAFAIIVGVTFVFVPLLILGAGATGGLDRVTSALLPLASFGLTAALTTAPHVNRSKRRRGLVRTIIILSTVALVCLSSVVLFAGWNFLSVPYSENFGGGVGPSVFVSCFGPSSASCYETFASQLGGFLTQSGVDINGGPLGFASGWTNITSKGFYEYTYTGYIDQVYSVSGHPTATMNQVTSNIQSADVYYSDGFTVIYYWWR